MANTSLALQLKRLATPQTSILIQKKKRASLLFDPSEAANIDRDTFYEIGISGLEQLITINEQFSEFRNSLFDETSKHFERAVENVATNKKLDDLIKRFLHLLSPYFLLKHTQKALEWLIVRYRINDHNVDDLLCLALPYHGTRLFARLIQVFNLKDSENKWYWLLPIQRKGVPLSKTALFNRCADEPSFLKLICSMTVDAARVYDDEMFKLATLFNFYCTTLLGGIEHMKKINEAHLSHMLPSLFYGLSVDCLDLNASVFIILTLISTKTAFEISLLHKLVYKIVKLKDKTLLKDAVILLTILYQRENLSKTSVPEKAIKYLANDPAFFVSTLSEFLRSVNVTNIFYIALVKDSLKFAQQSEDESCEKVRNFAEILLKDVRVDNSSAENLIRVIINTGDSDSQQWYCELVQNLEHQYPDPWDNVIPTLIKEGDRDSINHLLGFTSLASQIQVFQKLNDPNVDVRVEVIKYIAENPTHFNLKYLESSLNARWDDEEPEVLLAMYQLPSSIQCYNVLVFKSLLLKCWQQSKNDKWQAVLACTIKKLPELEIINNHELCLTVLLPFAVTGSDEVKNKLAQVTGIPFFQKMFAKESKNGLKTIKKLLKDGSISFDIKHLLDSFKELNREAVYTFTLLFLLSIKFGLVSDEDKLNILAFLFEELLPKYEKKLKKASARTWDNNSFVSYFDKTKTNHLPTEIVSYSIRSIIKSLPLPEQTETVSGWLNLYENDWKIPVQLYRYLITKCPIVENGDSNNYLELFLQHQFSSLLQRVNFICSFNALYFDDEQIRLVGSKLIFELINLSTDNRNWALNLETKNIVIATCLADAYSSDDRLRAVSVSIFDLLTTSIGSALSSSTVISPTYLDFLKHLLSMKEEILLDRQQLPVVVATFLSQNEEIQRSLPTSVRINTVLVLKQLLDLIMNRQTPACVSVCLLDVLKNVEDNDVVLTLMLYITDLLHDDESTDDDDVIQLYSSVAEKIIDRLNQTNVTIVYKKTPFTRLIDTCFDGTGSKFDDERRSSLANLLMRKLSVDGLFDMLDTSARAYVLNKIIDLLTTVQRPRLNSDFLSAVGSFLKRITLPGKLVIPYLDGMKNIISTNNHNNNNNKSPVMRTTKNGDGDGDGGDEDDDEEDEEDGDENDETTSRILETVEWRKGLKMMEYIQNKKKVKNPELVIPILFQVLQKCVELDEMVSTEYSKQVCLSCISNYTEKLTVSALTEETTERMFNIELIVKCIRVSPNPLTHHHALTLLSQCALFASRPVLHNVMSIFTFMGSSILRQDDAFSFQIIVRIMETLIPLLVIAKPDRNYVLLAASSSSDYDSTMVVSCLKVFANSAPDIPDHRRIPLLEKLIRIVGEEEFLWCFVVLLLECEVSDKQRSKKSNNTESKLSSATTNADDIDDSTIMTKHHSSRSSARKFDKEQSTKDSDRVLLIKQLSYLFDVRTILKCCAQLLKCLNKLPHEKGGKLDQKWHAKYKLFNVKCHSNYQLRHIKYLLISLCSSILSSSEFISQLAKESNNELTSLETDFENVIEEALMHVRSITKYTLKSKSETSKYWKMLIYYSIEIINKVNALLPSETFLNVLENLLNHDSLLIQRKMMELLNWRLQLQKGDPSAITQSDNLIRITEPLITIVKNFKLNDIPAENESEDNINNMLLNCQTSLISLKLITRHCNVFDYVNTFKKILTDLSNILRDTSAIPDPVLACALLCIAELISALKIHAIETLPVFIPTLINILQNHNSGVDVKADTVLLSVISALYKVMESLLNFLSPYLEAILFQISVLSTRLHQHYNEVKLSQFTPKLKTFKQKLSSNDITDRILVPSVSNCLGQLCESKEYDAVRYLMEILSDSFKSNSGFSAELTFLFLTGLEFRCKHIDTAPDNIDKVETYIVDAICDIALKCSESSFRPFYQKLYDWGVISVKYDNEKDKVITYYRLLNKLSEKFKSLFVLFATNFIRNAAELLDQNNITRYENCTDDMYFGADIQKSTVLVDAILSTLYNVFKYSAVKFITKERFNILCLPLINQLENTIGDYESRRPCIANCVAHFAVATTDDSLWKHFINLVLMKTRHSSCEIRLTALETACTFATLLGDNFLPFLPETVPFLAELLEDENEVVEKTTKTAIQKLEAALGEPIQKYF